MYIYNIGIDSRHIYIYFHIYIIHKCTFIYIYTARRCVLPGSLQGRSRHDDDNDDDDDDDDDEHGDAESRNVVPACLFETSELE